MGGGYKMSRGVWGTVPQWGTQSPSGDTVPQWGPGAKARQGVWGTVPQKLKHFCKYKPSNLRPRENYFNKSNNIMIIIVTLGTYIHKDLTDELD